MAGNQFKPLICHSEQKEPVSSVVERRNPTNKGPARTKNPTHPKKPKEKLKVLKP